MSCLFLEATALARLFVQGPGSAELIELLGRTEVNRKLISAATPLEIHAALRRRQRQGDLSLDQTTQALETLRTETSRMVQQPLNPAVLETARKVLDRHCLRWPEALQLAAALISRETFKGAAMEFVSSSPLLLEAARNEGFGTIDPVNLAPQAALAGAAL